MLKKYGIHVVLITACLLIILVPMFRDKPDPEKIRRATVAAGEFLDRVDAGDYETARKEGAELLKEKVSLNDWINKLDGTRTTLGQMIERKQIDASYSTSAKDSPDGEYVMLTYSSRYERRKEINETVVVMLDKNRGWRVAGYFFK